MLLDSWFLTLPSYSYRMHIHTRQLILMLVFFVIVKRYCLKSVLLKKWELLAVIKSWPKSFSTIPNSSYSRKYVLIRLTSRRVARNSQWGGCGGGAPSRRRLMEVRRRSPQPPRQGVWGQSPQPPESRGSGGGAPSARKFCIFLQK